MKFWFGGKKEPELCLSISLLSMAARNAYAARVLEENLLFDGADMREWEPFLSLVWARVWSHRLDMWEYCMLDFDPFCEEGPEGTTGAIRQFRLLCSRISPDTQKCIDDMYELGVAHVYSVVPKGVEYSTGILHAMILRSIERGITLPHLRHFTFSPFGESDGWGDISKERALSLRSPRCHIGPMTCFGDLLVAEKSAHEKRGEPSGSPNKSTKPILAHRAQRRSMA